MRINGNVAVRICCCLVLAASMVMLIAPGAAADETAPALAELLDQADAKRRQLLYDDAIGLLRQIGERAEEDRPTAALAQARLGRYLLDAGRPNEAEPELARVDQLFPEQISARRRAAVCRMDLDGQRGDLTGVEATTQALRVASVDMPEFRAWADIKLAEVAIARGQQAAAIPNLDDLATSIGETYPVPANWARVNLLRALTDLGDWGRAVTTARDVQSAFESGNASGVSGVEVSNNLTVVDESDAARTFETPDDEDDFVDSSASNVAFDQPGILDVSNHRLPLLSDLTGISDTLKLKLKLVLDQATTIPGVRVDFDGDERPIDSDLEGSNDLLPNEDENTTSEPDIGADERDP